MKKLALWGLLFLTGCAPVTSHPSSDYMDELADRLRSRDWETRYRSLLALRPFGRDANDAFVLAMGDKSDVISKTAQRHLIDQGETAIPYLIERLEGAREDAGLYARIAGGREEDRGKSLAGTLWLTLVRGVERDRCHEILSRLAEHRSARVRSVALFTAVTLRSNRFLDVVERLSSDRDPLVVARRREALVQLFMRDSYSTPELDAATTERGLALLRPELVAIYNSNEPGFTEYDQTIAEMLGRDRLAHHRERFVGMLREALRDPALTPDGALNVGRAIANQSEPQKPADRLGKDERSLKQLVTALEQADDTLAVQAALACSQALPDEPALKTAVRRQADRLFRITPTLDLRSLCGIVGLFARIGDNRYVALFEKAWEQRFAPTPGPEWTLGDLVKFFAARKDRTILPYVIAHVSSGSGVRHTHLKDVCVYNLTLRGWHELAGEFLTDDLFRRWMAIIQDPEEHPRFRAGFAPLLHNAAVAAEKRRELAEIFLKLARPPHDSNLRSKSIWALGLAGDRRVLPSLYEVAMDPDNHHFVWHNVFAALSSLHGATGEPGEKASPEAVKASARAMIDVLEAMLKAWPRPPDIEFIHVNNYFNWAVQYRIYPPRRAVERLELITKQNLGLDVAAWRRWLDAQ